MQTKPQNIPSHISQPDGLQGTLNIAEPESDYPKYPRRNICIDMPIYYRSPLLHVKSPTAPIHDKKIEEQPKAQKSDPVQPCSKQGRKRQFVRKDVLGGKGESYDVFCEGAKVQPIVVTYPSRNVGQYEILSNIKCQLPTQKNFSELGPQLSPPPYKCLIQPPLCVPPPQQSLTQQIPIVVPLNQPKQDSFEYNSSELRSRDSSLWPVSDCSSTPSSIVKEDPKAPIRDRDYSIGTSSFMDSQPNLTEDPLSVFFREMGIHDKRNIGHLTPESEPNLSESSSLSFSSSENENNNDENEGNEQNQENQENQENSEKSEGNKSISSPLSDTPSSLIQLSSSSSKLSSSDVLNSDIISSSKGKLGLSQQESKKISLKSEVKSQNQESDNESESKRYDSRSKSRIFDIKDSSQSFSKTNSLSSSCKRKIMLSKKMEKMKQLTLQGNPKNMSREDRRELGTKILKALGQTFKTLVQHVNKTFNI